MRVSTSVLSGAVGLVLVAGVLGASGHARAERMWTDDIPVGRPYVKPPLPARPMSEAQLVATLGPVSIPTLEPMQLDPLRTGVLEEITRLKAMEEDPQRISLLDALGSLYGGDLAGPFWIENGKFSQKARIAAAEMARADDYALDPAVFEVPSMELAGGVDAVRAEVGMSLAVMAYAREAFGMQFEPNSISLWLDHKPQGPEASDLLPRVSSAADPGAELRRLHPSHPAFEALRRAYLVATGRRAAEPPTLPPQIPDGPRLKVGDDHPHVALVRERLDVPADDVEPTYLDRELGNEIRNILRRNGKRRVREINDDLRALLNAPPPPKKLPDAKVIEANMLRWRWLPRDLGSVHVWNNIPEFTTRLFKDGEKIHEERIIVGQTDQQTPVFSDTMEKIVFKPQWGVPNSIKVTDLLPRLRGGDTNVLARRGMKIISSSGREISPHRIRWSSADIRYMSIVQGPSAWNPLGQMKFMFPNHHAVYMHDTTSKHLFSSRERTFSHGCIRVRNPRKLAEVIFEDVQGWDIKRIPELLGRRAEDNNEVYLDKPIAVHNVYFTLVPDGQGGFRQFKDVYGHDRRIIQALQGKSLRWIAANDPARIHKRRVQEIERSSRYNRSSYSNLDTSQRADSSRSGSSFDSTYRSSLGAPSPAPVRRAKPRVSRQIAPAWPPQFRYD